MVELTLGFWLPVLASAVLEAREDKLWEQARQQAGTRVAVQAGDRRPWGQRLQLRVYREVNAMLHGEDPCGPTLVVMLLVGTCDLLVLAMPL